ncbi:hypothetical protein Anas_14289 [Armadillidium nasatum]|uniref:Uncharacterized protein n=1 Tax=Armadillidium nasatum TaxID=96803 RepID=A0A5N5SIE1_9CRUS|nr:hypothetical protein Anas_14289 [Armadillidium nasatum]
MRPWTFLAFLVVILALASTSPVPDWSDELFYYSGPNAANRLVRNRNIAATGHWISLPRTLLRFFFSFS